MTEVGNALYAWIGENNPPPEAQYAKGFWDYFETLDRLLDKFEAQDIAVVGAYEVHTPPPEEVLTFPAVSFAVHGVAFAVRYDFGASSMWPLEWVVSVKRRWAYEGSLFGLFDPAVTLDERNLAGFGEEWRFPPFVEDQRCFTCGLVDEFDVSSVVRIMALQEAPR